MNWKTTIVLAVNVFLLLFITKSVLAENAINECISNQYQQGDDSLTLYEIRRICQPGLDDVENAEDVSAETKSEPSDFGILSQRMLKESRTEFDSYVITPHRLNYILPALTTSAINKGAYTTFNGYEENLEDVEAKFQLSLKVPLTSRSLFVEGDGLYFAFTIQAWWQIYADNISKPFRETNYQPELFYFSPLKWRPFGGNTGYTVGIEHQSNGRAQDLSRSWNRVFFQMLFEKDNFAVSLRPWYRIEEDPKQFPFDPNGDDNPDIEDFMGHFQLGMVYKRDDLQFGLGVRENFATHNGALELSMIFPLWGRYRGYVTVFDGYGDSLIDYNYEQTRFGLGISLNDFI